MSVLMHRAVSVNGESCKTNGGMVKVLFGLEMIPAARPTTVADEGGGEGRGAVEKKRNKTT